MECDESANWQVEKAHPIYSTDVWTQDWLPLKAAVQAGELTAEEALRQYRAILDERFKVRAATWTA